MSQFPRVCACCSCVRPESARTKSINHTFIYKTHSTTTQARASACGICTDVCASLHKYVHYRHTVMLVLCMTKCVETRGCTSYLGIIRFRSPHNTQHKPALHQPTRATRASLCFIIDSQIFQNPRRCCWELA